MATKKDKPNVTVTAATPLKDVLQDTKNLPTEGNEKVSSEGTKFKKGESGNPAGRPKGSKNKTTLIKQAIEADMIEALQKNSDVLIQAAIERAISSSDALLNKLLDKLLANAKDGSMEVSRGSGSITINVTGTGASVTASKKDGDDDAIEGEIC